MHTLKIATGLTLAALLGMSSAAVAETVKLKAAMNAGAVVPTNDSKGTGTADLTYDTATKNLTWTVTFKDTKSAPTVAHFHGPAEPGKNAGVAVLIGNNPTSPATGMATLTDEQATALLGGLWYVNIHTAEHRGGEIRGQVTK
jgi:CHRD domain